MYKFVVLLMLLIVVASLFSGLYYLIRDRGTGERLAKALTWRIGISVVVFILLLLGYRFGLIPGHGRAAHGGAAPIVAGGFPPLAAASPSCWKNA